MRPSDKNNIDELFKQGLSDFELEPSSAVWNNIDNQLTKKKASFFTTNVLKFSIAASVLICLFLGFYYTNSINRKNEIALQNNNSIDSNSKKVSTEKIIEKKSKTMQPIQNDNRLADVVELKTSSSKTVKGIKKVNTTGQVKKPNRTNEENEAIDLLKKLEDEQAEINKINSETKKAVVPAKVSPVPAPSVAVNKNEKREINSVIDMLNFVATKVTGDEESKLVAVNDKKKMDGSSRKTYKIDLGFVKLSRVKNTN